MCNCNGSGKGTAWFWVRLYARDAGQLFVVAHQGLFVEWASQDTGRMYRGETRDWSAKTLVIRLLCEFGRAHWRCEDLRSCTAGRDAESQRDKSTGDS